MKMKKHILWLLLLGIVCFSFETFTRSFFKTPDSIGDFLKGFGVVLMVYGLAAKLKWHRTNNI
jgi:hypothetical protein